MPTLIIETRESAGWDEPAVSPYATNLVPTLEVHQARFNSQHHIRLPHHRSKSYSYIFHTRGSFHQAHIQGWQLGIKCLKIKPDRMSTNKVLEIKLQRAPERTAGPSVPLLPLKHGDSGSSMDLQLGASTCGSKLRWQEEKRLPYFPVIPRNTAKFQSISSSWIKHTVRMWWYVSDAWEGKVRQFFSFFFPPSVL